MSWTTQNGVSDADHLTTTEVTIATQSNLVQDAPFGTNLSLLRLMWAKVMVQSTEPYLKVDSLIRRYHERHQVFCNYLILEALFHLRIEKCFVDKT